MGAALALSVLAVGCAGGDGEPEQAATETAAAAAEGGTAETTGDGATATADGATTITIDGEPLEVRDVTCETVLGGDFTIRVDGPEPSYVRVDFSHHPGGELSFETARVGYWFPHESSEDRLVAWKTLQADQLDASEDGAAGTATLYEDHLTMEGDTKEIEFDIRC